MTFQQVKELMDKSFPSYYKTKGKIDIVVNRLGFIGTTSNGKSMIAWDLEGNPLGEIIRFTKEGQELFKLEELVKSPITAVGEFKK